MVHDLENTLAMQNLPDPRLTRWSFSAHHSVVV
uniref:Uncharacterized protein n=1 Tax=Arundo donax TaxID=35708 RepID=A0A0A8YTB4_ARUDO